MEIKLSSLSKTLTSVDIAFDPGGTTGFAWLKAYSDGAFSFGGGQITGQHHAELHTLVASLSKDSDSTAIICERFDYRQKSRSGLVLDSREYIGVLKTYSQIHKVPFYLQSASQAKGFVKDTHIKRLDLWVPSNGHRMDALRHLIYFTVNNKDGNQQIRDFILRAAFK